LAFAILHLERAQEAARHGKTDSEALTEAARLLIAGFPTSPDAFGATWASTASLLYLQAGHDRTALEVAESYCERAQRSAVAIGLGSRLLERLLQRYGKRSPEKLVQLWRSFHGGAPPRPGNWWEKYEAAPRTPHHLLGQVPTTSRIRGTHKGGAMLSEREKKRRYGRFRRRRRRPKLGA
jgi:hypothetical protein